MKVLALLLLAAASLSAQQSHPVLMISIDGLRPDYITHADEHGLKIPTLRRILAEGAHAEGVTGVLPTVTYPSHTTLVTGVWPVQHGILNNVAFDPENKFRGAWYWYFSQIKMPTLWAAVHISGRKTASVSWPVTAGSNMIDYLLPEYWRGNGPGDNANRDDRLLMDALSRPDGELLRMTARIGSPYMNGNDTNPEGDEVRTLYSLDILKQHQPAFMTIHLSSLDEEEHLHGPFSPEANQDVERLDGMVDRLMKQAQANDPAAVIVVVSDHGFLHVEKSLNLYVPFIQSGLIKIAAGKVANWDAEPWPYGSGYAIKLHDPNSAATKKKVRDLLDHIAASPANGVEAILDHDAVVAQGGDPGATFVVTLKKGFTSSGALSGPLVDDSPMNGTHGYDPRTTPEMRSSFFVAGPSIAHGKDLGVVDMRQIAPTIAAILGVTLPSAQQPPLAVH